METKGGEEDRKKERKRTSQSGILAFKRRKSVGSKTTRTRDCFVWGPVIFFFYLCRKSAGWEAVNSVRQPANAVNTFFFI